MGNLKGWRGVFMRETLPLNVKNNECGVLNLDDKDSKGTHWTCWYINGSHVYYFDSYGLPPPKEFIQYIRHSKPAQQIIYNTFQLQRATDGPICGHLCVQILRNKNSTSFLEWLLKIQSRSI